MDQHDSRKRPILSPTDTMLASQADIKAGQTDDLEAYLKRISQEVDAALAAKRRGSAVDC